MVILNFSYMTASSENDTYWTSVQMLVQISHFFIPSISKGLSIPLLMKVFSRNMCISTSIQMTMKTLNHAKILQRCIYYY